MKIGGGENSSNTGNGSSVKTVAITLTVLAAILSAALSLGTIFQPGWLVDFAIVLGLLALVTGGARLIGRRYGKSPAALAVTSGVLFGSWLILTMFGGTAANAAWPAQGPLLPSLGSFAQLHQLFSQGLFEVETSSAPLELTPALLFIVIAGAIALFILAEALANSKLAYLAVLPIVGLWAPALGLGWGIDRTHFALACLAYVLVLAASYGDKVQLAVPSVRRNWHLATGALVVVALGAGVGTSVYAARYLESYRLLPFSRTVGTGSGLGMMLDTSQALSGTKEIKNLFTYTPYTSTANGGIVIKESVSQPFRIATYTNFDGRTWEQLPQDLQQPVERDAAVADGGQTIPVSGNKPADFLGKDPADADENALSDETLELIAITFDQYPYDRLPVTSDPRKISNEGSWQWQLDSVNDTAYPMNPLRAGMQLALYSYTRDLQPNILRQHNTEFPANPELAPAFLDIPTRNAKKIIRAAEDIAGDVTNRFDIAVALVSYLSDPNTFTYTQQPPTSRTGNMVTDLIESGSGYCVHFATAMVLLSRALGVPARLAVGYLPGEPTSPTKWLVTSADSHAWAEIYFGPEIGWVPFDPTPPDPASTTAVGATLVSSWAIPTSVLPSVSGDGDGYYYGDMPYEYIDPYSPYASDPYSTVSTTQYPDFDEESVWIQSGTKPSLANTGGMLRDNWLYWTAIGGALLFSAAAFAVRRWQLKQLAELNEELAWAKAKAALGRHGILVETATTPRQLEAAVVEGWTLKYQNRPPAQLLTALGTISSAVETSRYDQKNNSTLTKELTEALRQVKNTKRPSVRHLKAD